MLFILVTFICGNHHTYLHAIRRTDCLKNMDCSHYIGFVGFNRDVITQANQRLGSKMKNNLRLIFLKDSLYTLTIADIGTKVGLNFLADTGKYEIVSNRKGS